MAILGLEPAAQVIVLQTAATYAAAGSAYVLLRPVLRGQLVQAHRDVLASLDNEEGDVGALIARASAALAAKAEVEAPKVARDNRWGLTLLVLSFLLFSLALWRQVSTDPAFRQTDASTHHAVL